MILHIFPLEKFTQPYIDLIDSNFDSSEHYFFILNRYNLSFDLNRSRQNLYEVVTPSVGSVSHLIKLLHKSERVIIHSLGSKQLVTILFLLPWLLKKCFHVMWGGDFYFPEKQSWTKKRVIRRMGRFVAYVPGDFELLKQWYGASSPMHECLMYASNLYNEYQITTTSHSTTNILVGNSAAPSNNHTSLFRELEKFKDEDIQLLVPLSYGAESDEDYRQEILKQGKELFGEKFQPLTEFMPFNEYLSLLGSIDMALFAHKRQQGMGTTISLLGLGKKVFIRSDTTHWDFFQKQGIKIFDIHNPNLTPLTALERKQNCTIVKEYFSEEKLIAQWKSIFEVSL